jgi:TPR repeat protein
LRYANGRGVNKNYRRAERWLRTAADQGNMRAQYNLGVLHQHGWGVTKNLQTAAQHFSDAASQGYSKAVRALTVVKQAQENELTPA